MKRILTTPLPCLVRLERRWCDVCERYSLWDDRSIVPEIALMLFFCAQAFAIPVLGKWPLIMHMPVRVLLVASVVFHCLVAYVRYLRRVPREEQ